VDKFKRICHYEEHVQAECLCQWDVFFVELVYFDWIREISSLSAIVLLWRDESSEKHRDGKMSHGSERAMNQAEFRTLPNNTYLSWNLYLQIILLNISLRRLTLIKVAWSLTFNISRSLRNMSAKIPTILYKNRINIFHSQRNKNSNRKALKETVNSEDIVERISRNFMMLMFKEEL